MRKSSDLGTSLTYPENINYFSTYDVNTYKKSTIPSIVESKKQQVRMMPPALPILSQHSSINWGGGGSVITLGRRMGSGNRLILLIAGIILLGGIWGSISLEDHAWTAVFPPDFLEYAWAQVTGVMSPFEAGRIGDRGGVSLEEARDVAIFESGGTTYAAVTSYKAGARPNTDYFGDNSRIGGGVQILKLTDSNGVIRNNPQAVSQIRDADGRDLNGATGIITFESGGTTYAAVASYRDDGLQIIDLSDPENPNAAGHLRDPGGQSFNEAWDVAVFGTANTYAALTGKGSNNVQIIDFSDLSSLQNVGGIGRYDALIRNPRGIDTFEAGGITYAAVTSSRSSSLSGVQILDLSDPTSPSDAGRITNTGSLELHGAWDIAIFEATSGVNTLTYAAVASHNDNGVQILQLTGSNGMILANPAPAGKITDGGNRELNGAQSIAIFEAGGTTYAAVASRDDNGVQLLQLTGSNGMILDNPAPAGKISNNGSRELHGARGIAIFEATSGGNTFAYAAVASDNDNGVQILRLNTPPSVNAAALGTIETAGSIADNGSRVLKGASGIATFKSDGVNYAAVAADRDNGIQIVSFADLAGPYAAGKINDDDELLLDDARGIATFESTSGTTTTTTTTTTYAAVASYGNDGVQIISLADPANPIPAGKLANTGSLELNGAHDIAIFEATSGNTTTAYAAVAAYDDAGVQIINLSNPSNPTPAGKIADAGNRALSGPSAIATFESGGTTYAAVASQIENGIQMLRLTDSNGMIQANPSSIGKITDNDSRVLTVPQHIAIFESGGTTYAAVTSSVEDGVQIISLANPASPVAVASVTDSTDTNLTDYEELEGATGITIFVSGGRTYAAVASDVDKGVQIIDLSNPASPKAVGQITDDDSTLLQSATGIATFERGGTIHVAVTSNNEHGVQILVPHPSPFHEGDTVILSGGAFDPDGHTLTYAWQRNSGPQVSIADNSALSTTFTAPQVPGDRTITFTLTVSDADSTSESVAVRIRDTISPPNNTPTVEAGPDQTVDEGDTVTLSGTASDPEGNTLVYRWTHDSDLPIGLADSRIPTTTFTAPEVAFDTTVTFTLEASDGTESASDDITVIITHVNKPPTAEAGPSYTVDAGDTVTLSGTASDPDSTQLTYSWTHDSDLPIYSASPENPEAVGSIVDTEGSGEIFLHGARGIATFESGGTTYAAVASSADGGVQIIDLSDPENPEAAGSSSTDLSFVWDVATFESGGTTYVAATATGDSNVNIIDLSDPAAPSSVGIRSDTTTNLLSDPRSIATFESGSTTYAAVTSTVEDGVQIIDLSDPAAPSDAGKLADTTGTNGLLLDGAWDIATFVSNHATYAAVTSSVDAGVQIIDLSDPAAPSDAGKLVNTNQLLLNASSYITTFVSNHITYAAVTSNGVQILQLTDPDGAILANPAPAGQIADGGSLLLGGAGDITVFFSNHTAYAAVASFNDDGVQIIDLSDPTDPQAVANATDSTVSNPTDYDRLNGAHGITTFESGGTTYAAVTGNLDNGVQIIRLAESDALSTTFTAPEVVSHTSVTFTLTVSDGTDSVSDDTVVTIYSTVSLASPEPEGQIANDDDVLLDGPWDVATFELTDGTTTNTYAAVTSTNNHGVQILRLTDTDGAILAIPSAVGSIADDTDRVLHAPRNIATFESTSGGIATTYAAVVSAGEHGVQIIDLSDPTDPQAVASVTESTTSNPTDYDTLNGAQAITIFESGGTTYAAVTSSRGIQIINLSDPTMPSAAGSLRASNNVILSDVQGIVTFESTSGGITTLYAAATSLTGHGVQIIDLSDPTDPQAVANAIDSTVSNPTDYSELEGARGIATFISDGTTYAAVAAFDDDGIQIIDLSDPTDPQATGILENTSNLELDGAWNIATFESAGTAYAAVTGFWDDGVQILRLSDPENPEFLGKIENSDSLLLQGVIGIDIFELGDTTYAAVVSHLGHGVQIISLGQAIPKAEVQGKVSRTGSAYNGECGVTVIGADLSAEWAARITMTDSEGATILDGSGTLQAGSATEQITLTDGVLMISGLESDDSVTAHLSATNIDRTKSHTCDISLISAIIFSFTSHVPAITYDVSYASPTFETIAGDTGISYGISSFKETTVGLPPIVTGDTGISYEISCLARVDGIGPSAARAEGITPPVAWFMDIILTDGDEQTVQILSGVGSPAPLSFDKWHSRNVDGEGDILAGRNSIYHGSAGSPQGQEHGEFLVAQMIRYDADPDEQYACSYDMSVDNKHRAPDNSVILDSMVRASGGVPDTS